MIMNHTHGVPQQRCDHPDCKEATSRYRKRWKLDVTRGNYRTIPADETRLHIFALKGQGWSERAIAGAAGVSNQLVSHLVHGQRTVTRRLAVKILAVRVEDLPRAASRQTVEPFVPRVGTVRRLQALMTLGWTHQAMSEWAGYPGGRWTANLMSQQGQWVTRTTHDKVAAMYRELSTKPGPSDATRRRARRMGYATPLDWDNIDMDPEPESHVVLRSVIGSNNGVTREWVEVDDVAADEPGIDEVVVMRRLEGHPTRRLTPEESEEVARRARAMGWTDSRLESVANIKCGRHREEAS